MIDYAHLYQLALSARQNAYCPYSHFAVGAALLTASGRVFCGCNVENASYGATMCAERVAIGNAVAAGHKDFVAIAIVGGGEALSPCPPCGICRQVLSEFGSPSMEIVTYTADGAPVVRTLQTLLPAAFDLSDRL